MRLNGIVKPKTIVPVDSDRHSRLGTTAARIVVSAIFVVLTLLGASFMFWSNMEGALTGAKQAIRSVERQMHHWINLYTELNMVTSDELRVYIDVNRVVTEHDKQRECLQRVLDNGPLRVHPENGRYFMDGRGTIVYLTGSHYWLNLQDGVLTDPPPAFDYTGYLDFLESQNHNFFRLWTWEQAKWVVEWHEPYYFSPMPYERTGPGTALDGKLKFDLTKFNQAYFDRLRERVIEAGERGMYVSVMLFNGWSTSYPKGFYQLANPWEGHPYNAANNINGIDGDVNDDNSGGESHTLVNPAVTELQEAYVRKVIDTVNDLDNVLYEISNESDGGSEQWQYHMINLIKSYEATKPKQHPVGMTVEWPGGDNQDLFNSPADWISPNGSLDDPPAADGSKVIIDDTDHLCGICGDRMWVWKSFTRGRNPIFMDQYDDSYKLDGGGYDPNNANDVSLRKNLGYTRMYADQMNLAGIRPRGDLSSTGYVLANPGMSGAEYLVYAPNGGEFTVDLRGVSGMVSVEWFNPESGVKTAAAAVSGGANRSFTPPFSGDAVLYLISVDAPPETPTPSPPDFNLYLPGITR